MNFTKYQHVERIGTTETDGILDGDVLVFPKIDFKLLNKAYIDKVKETMSEIF